MLPLAVPFINVNRNVVRLFKGFYEMVVGGNRKLNAIIPLQLMLILLIASWLVSFSLLSVSQVVAMKAR